MRHYLGIDSTGKVVSLHTYVDSPTQMGGWPLDFDICNPDSESAWVQDWLKKIKKKPEGGFVCFDCPCSPTEKTCRCPSVKMRGAYVVGGELVDCAASAFQIEGATVTPDHTLTRAPGTTVDVRVLADVPDGTTATVYRSDMPAVFVDPTIEVTFTGGVAGPFQITAPAQGFSGSIEVDGLKICPSRLTLRGWA